MGMHAARSGAVLTGLAASAAPRGTNATVASSGATLGAATPEKQRHHFEKPINTHTLEEGAE